MRDAVAKNAKTPLQQHHSRRDQCRRRVLAGGEERVLRGPRQSAAGVSEDQRDFRDAGKKVARRGRRVLHLRLRFVQRMCGVRHRLRRAQALRMVQETEEVNAEHETGTAFLDLLPDTSQKYLGPLQRHAAAGFQDRDAAQHADGSQELRRARLWRRRVRRLRREEHSQGDYIGHRSVHAADLPRESRSVPRQGRRARSGRAWRSWPPSRSAARRSTRSSARRSRICSWALEARTRRTRRRAWRRTVPSRTRISSARLRPSCGRRRSITRTCRPSMAGSPTGCR